MKILYFGKGVRGERCLEALLLRREPICGLVLEPGENSQMASLAQKLGIPVYSPAKVNSDEFIAEIKKLSPDFFILSGYSKILKRKLLDLPPQGAINLHGGKLPSYRGTAPINWQIINGEKTGGCSILYVDEGIDTGDLLAQEEYPILPDDDASTVVAKTLEIFPRLLMGVLDQIRSGTLKRQKQDPEAGCHYTRRAAQDGQIDWKNLTSLKIHNLVRALVKPYPGAFTFLEGQKIYIWKTSLLSRQIRGVPGRIPLKTPEGVIAIAQDQGILIESVSFEGSSEIVPATKVFKIGDTLR